MTVPDYEGPQQEGSRGSSIDTWSQLAEFRSWKISFKREVSHSSQYSRAAMPRIGEVEDVSGIDDLVTSASTTGRPIPDFEDLEFKIASGLRKIFTGIFKKPCLQCRQKRSTRGEIYDFFKLGGDNDVLDFRDLSKVHLKNDHVQALDEVLSAVTDRLTDSILVSLYKMHVWKTGRNENLSQVNAQETTPGDKKVRLLQNWVDGTKTSRAENQMFTFQCEKSRWGRQVEEKQKEKTKTTPKEETASVRSRTANVRLEKHAHSSRTRTKKAKGRDDLSHTPTGRLHGNSKGDRKGCDDGSCEGHTKTYR